MSVLVVGLSHHTAPVGMLKRAAVPADDAGKVLAELLGCEHVSEVLLLSTCNRVEVYTVVGTFHGGLADVSGVLARHSGAALEELSGHLYVHYADAGVEHLFRVAAGLDSMVVGEPQILGQLRAGYNDAVVAQSIGRTLHELAQQALRAGKRVHAETGIDAAGASVVSEALADADAAVGGLAGRRAVVIGAGSMGALAAARLCCAGVAEIVVANRSAGPAEGLAASCEEEGTSARAIGARRAVRRAGDRRGRGELHRRSGRRAVRHAGLGGAWHRTAPLAVCDLGMPPDVEATAGKLPGVTLVDLTTLQLRLQTAASGADTTTTTTAHRIVAEEVRGYLSAQRSAEVTPTVTALRRGSWTSCCTPDRAGQTARRERGRAGLRRRATRTVRTRPQTAAAMSAAMSDPRGEDDR